MTKSSPINNLTSIKRLIGAAIFLIVFAIFWLSPIRDMTDSNYAMFTSENCSIITPSTLDRYRWPAIQTVPRSGLGANTTIYQLESVNGHLFYYFPPGTSILSAPYVALLNGFGVSSVNPDGSYRADGELAIQGSLAALLMALATAVFLLHEHPSAAAGLEHRDRAG